MEDQNEYGQDSGRRKKPEKGIKGGLRNVYSVPTTSLKCRVDTGLLSEVKPGPSTEIT